MANFDSVQFATNRTATPRRFTTSASAGPIVLEADYVTLGTEVVSDVIRLVVLPPNYTVVWGWISITTALETTAGTVDLGVAADVDVLLDGLDATAAVVTTFPSLAAGISVLPLTTEQIISLTVITVTSTTIDVGGVLKLVVMCAPLGL